MSKTLAQRQKDFKASRKQLNIWLNPELQERFSGNAKQQNLSQAEYLEKLLSSNWKQTSTLEPDVDIDALLKENAKLKLENQLLKEDTQKLGYFKKRVTALNKQVKTLTEQQKEYQQNDNYYKAYADALKKIQGMEEELLVLKAQSSRVKTLQQKADALEAQVHDFKRDNDKLRAKLRNL